MESKILRECSLLPFTRVFLFSYLSSLPRVRSSTWLFPPPPSVYLSFLSSPWKIRHFFPFFPSFLLRPPFFPTDITESNGSSNRTFPLFFFFPSLQPKEWKPRTLFFFSFSLFQPLFFFPATKGPKKIRPFSFLLVVPPPPLFPPRVHENRESDLTSYFPPFFSFPPFFLFNPEERVEGGERRRKAVFPSWQGPLETFSFFLSLFLSSSQEEELFLPPPLFSFFFSPFFVVEIGDWRRRGFRLSPPFRLLSLHPDVRSSFLLFHTGAQIEDYTGFLSPPALFKRILFFFSFFLRKEKCEASVYAFLLFPFFRGLSSPFFPMRR